MKQEEALYTLTGFQVLEFAHQFAVFWKEAFSEELELHTQHDHTGDEHPIINLELNLNTCLTFHLEKYDCDSEASIGLKWRWEITSYTLGRINEHNSDKKKNLVSLIDKFL